MTVIHAQADGEDVQVRPLPSRAAQKRIITRRLEEMDFAPANQFEAGGKRLGEMCFFFVFILGKR
jgi:hypothetical protein